MSDTAHTKRLIDIWMFTCTRFSLSDRVLLAMNSYQDRSGFCHLTARDLAALVGAASEEELDSAEGRHPMIKKVQAARNRLVEEGLLRPVTTEVGRRTIYKYQILSQPMPSSALEKWGKVAGKGRSYTAVVAGDAPKSPQKETTSLEDLRALGGDAAVVADWLSEEDEDPLGPKGLE
jgi:hypothetical protein